MDDAAAPAVAHEGGHRLGEDEGAHQVDAEHFGEVGRADVEERRAEADGGAIDEDIHTTLLGSRFGHEPGHIRLAAHVAAHGRRGPAGLADGVHGFGQGLGPTPEDDDTRALGREQLRGGPADAGAAPRYQCHLALKPGHGRSSCRRPSWDSADTWAFAPCTSWRRSP